MMVISPIAIGYIKIVLKKQHNDKVSQVNKG